MLHTRLHMYCTQVLVYELYNDAAKCENITSTTVLFTDNGMDAARTCSPENGGCALTYSFVPGLNFTDRGIQYGPFQGGLPNLAAVSYDDGEGRRRYMTLVPLSATACWHACS